MIENVQNELFGVKPASVWIDEAKRRPIPKMLFGEFWLEGEIAILFADTGKGKSILAVQIAEALARGSQIENLANNAPAQRVLYIDFELTAKQFEMRYADNGDGTEDELKNHYEFSPNFLRAEAKTLEDHPRPMYKSFDDYLTVMMNKLLRATEAKILIIDNLTCLKQRNESTDEAVRLMKALKEQRKEFGLSILVLAHTPKRALKSPLTVNDLQGSKVLSNFADNIFAIGGSAADSDVRYLKHIKLRSTEMAFDGLNVPTFRIAKRNKNFLAFNFLKLEDERVLLGSKVGDHDTDLMTRIRQAAGRGLSQRAIANELGISKTTVNRYMRIPTVEEQRWKRLTPEQQRVESLQRAIALRYQSNQSEKTANQEVKAQLQEITPYIPLKRVPADYLINGIPGDDEDIMAEEKCDCFECISGNEERCLDTDWSEQCCDGTNPNCCSGVRVTNDVTQSENKPGPEAQ